MEAKRAEKERVRDDLFEQVLSPANLTTAWKRVKANGGAAGVDGMETGVFPAFARSHWETIAVKLREGTYKPSPVRRVLIPKGRGRFRPLGIPTVLDRVIQPRLHRGLRQAIAQVLGEIHDPNFSEHSYGFRPGRSAHHAIEAMRGMSLKKGYGGRRCHVVDCDLETFFDTVNHQKMMSRLRESVDDERLLDLIERFLKAGAILPDGTYEKSHSGVPQGGPLSPLLANILLDELDRELEGRGHAFVRYADDFVILCHGRKAAERVLASVTRWISRRLRLTVNEAKSKVVPLAEAAFLGFRILRKKVRWTDRSRTKLKAQVRAITKRTRGVSPHQVMVDLQRYLRGAVNYYALGIPYREIIELDQWLRRRVRLYHWKQWGRPRTRRRKLLALGIDRDEVHMASRSRKGHPPSPRLWRPGWRMSRNSLVHRAMTDAWLHSQGVPDLAKQWVVIRYPDGSQGSRGIA